MFREFDYENKPVVDIVNEIIEDSVKKGASDIHFDPDETGVDVRIRIDGELRNYCRVPDSAKRNLITRVKIISGMNITETRLPQDGAIKNLNGKDKLDMRVSSLPTIYGEKIVIRILDYTLSLEGLSSIGFSDVNLKKVQQVIKSPNGIILVAGATGSGKSTTTYSMLQTVNKPELNIITVEDPVEMKIKGLNQVQVMSEIGLDFNTTLRSILRQDPDIIMIGEIRDSETARIAVRASITGHLVFSTIHTNNSLNTIERLLDMDVERYLLGTALEGVISQRLVKKVCPKCRKSRPTTQYEKNLFKQAIGKDVDTIYEAVGCDDCINGYRGRTSIHEVLLLNQDIRDAITNNVNKETLRELVYGKGETITLLQDGLEKVLKGLTTIDEIVRVIDIDSDFAEKDDDLKKAFLGKSIDSNKQPKKEEVKKEEAKEETIETLDTLDIDTTPEVVMPKEEVKVEEPTPLEDTTPVIDKPAPVIEDAKQVEETVVEQPPVVEEVKQPEPALVVEEVKPEPVKEDMPVKATIKESSVGADEIKKIKNKFDKKEIVPIVPIKEQEPIKPEEPKLNRLNVIAPKGIFTPNTNGPIKMMQTVPMMQPMNQMNNNPYPSVIPTQNINVNQMQPMFRPVMNNFAPPNNPQ